MTALTSTWRQIYSDRPVKHSKTDAYAIGQFHENSAASAYPFRLCLQCREEDLRSYAMTYWHCEHHIAGVDVCPKHQAALKQVGWRHVYTAPNPLDVQGGQPDGALILASAHPILIRYRDIALHVMRNPARVRYAYSHEQLLARATEMGLCRRKLAHRGNFYLEHKIPQYLYSRLPRAWLAQHFDETFLDTAFIPMDTCSDSYHVELKQLDYPVSAKPIFLLLALAALFESSEQICALLFEQ